MVEVAMDEELLQEIAQETGGHYFLATNQQMLASIYANINELEKSEANETLFLIREPLYLYPLALSLFVLFALTLSRRAIYGS